MAKLLSIAKGPFEKKNETNRKHYLLIRIHVRRFFLLGLFFFNANTELTTDDIVSKFKARSNKTQLNANVFTYTHRHGRIRMAWYPEKEK